MSTSGIKFTTMAYKHSYLEFLLVFQNHAWVPLCRVGFRISQKVIGYPYNCNTNIAQMETSRLAG